MIRKAKSADKSVILKFCKKTFSWGDYIKDVWDYWISEGNLFVIEKNSPMGICHAYFSKNQVWIEGIRINPKFRKKGLASKLVKKVESLAIKKKIQIALMLIDTENFPSLIMAQKLGYRVFQTWNFYSLFPKQNKLFQTSFGMELDVKVFSHHVKSWRWIPLDQKTISILRSKNLIVHSKESGKKTVAILGESEHFDQTLIVTLLSGSKTNTKNIILFLQNYGFKNNYKRLQILTKESLPNFDDLEKRLSFHLMQKLLS